MYSTSFNHQPQKQKQIEKATRERCKGNAPNGLNSRIYGRKSSEFFPQLLQLKRFMGATRFKHQTLWHLRANFPPWKTPFAFFYDMKDELWPKEPHEREYSHQFTQIWRKNATIALPVYFFLLASNAQILPSVRKRISIVFWFRYTPQLTAYV